MIDPKLGYSPQTQELIERQCRNVEREDFELDKKTSDMIRRLGFPIHSEDQFRKRLKNLSNKFFGYPIGIDDYRHIYEINLQKSDAYKNMTVLQQKKEHEKLYHSMQTALLYNRI